MLRVARGDVCFGLDIQLGRAVDPGPALHSARVYGFADIGAVRNLDEGASPDSAHIASVGLGAGFGFSETLRGKVEIGFPMRQSHVADPDSRPRATLNITWDF